ncbi:MAG TPA: hypothetical protein VF374_08265 [Thermoplasmata archaeon]|jgi:hypothetical protein
MTDRPRTDNTGDEAKEKEVSLDLTDLGSLVSLARSSEDHEAYRVVAGSRHFRVGLEVTAAPDTPISFRIEVLLQILAKDTQPRIADLERMNKILEDLTEREYSLDHHDSCWVSCEREVAVDDIERECAAIIAIIQRKEGVKA